MHSVKSLSVFHAQVSPKPIPAVAAAADIQGCLWGWEVRLTFAASSYPRVSNSVSLYLRADLRHQLCAAGHSRAWCLEVQSSSKCPVNKSVKAVMSKCLAHCPGQLVLGSSSFLTLAPSFHPGPAAGILCGAVPGEGCHFDRACEYLGGKVGSSLFRSDSSSTLQVIRGLLKYWPKTCTQKEV